MNKLKSLALATSVALGSVTLGGCATTSGYDDGGWGYYDSGYYRQYGRYDYNRPDPRYQGYYADRYYRDDPRYHERVLSRDDRIYRGRDGRFYCRRSDGSTGLVVGAITGGVVGGALGNALAQGDSKTLGTVLGALAGAAAGAAIGDSVDRQEVRCR
jgi:uncharacterized protein YcfJ